MKKRFVAISMISFLVTASPVLAQVSIEPNQLEQGLVIIRVTVEWIVLLGLILAMFTSSWLVANRRSNQINDRLKVLIAPIFLGTLAGGTAIILEEWTQLLILDVSLALAEVVFFLVATLTLPKLNEEYDLENTLRPEYDLKSLTVRKFGPGRKSFNGKSEP
jgi:protein-S-isoprenylcysteine O-methyltransferase Ste14